MEFFLPEWSITFIEFIDIRESDKSLKYEQGGFNLKSLSLSCFTGSVVASEVPGSSPFIENV